MNITYKNNIKYRVIASILLLLSLGLIGFSIFYVFQSTDNEKVLTLITLFLTAAFCILEIILIIKGGKKDLALYKIAFNENQSLNNVPLIAVIVGSVFGLGLTILGIILFITKQNEPMTLSSSLVILSVSVYLLINCIIYFIYLIIFRKKPVNLKDFI